MTIGATVALQTYSYCCKKKKTLQKRERKRDEEFHNENEEKVSFQIDSISAEEA